MSRQYGRPVFTDIFIERPILAIVFSLCLVLAGLRAAQVLPVMLYPRIESAALEIITPYVGASADVVQGFVTDPIARAASTVPGVDYVDSNTLAGVSNVTAFLKLNENSTDALAELTTRLGQIRHELPAGAQEPSIRVNRADRNSAAFYLPVEMGRFSRSELTDYLVNQVNPRLSGVEGIQRIGVEAGRLPAMRIWLDPLRLSAFNVSPSEVAKALTNNNIIATLGKSENSLQRVDLLTNTTLQTPGDFERLVVRDDSGAQILISDLGRVEKGEVEGNVDARMSHDDVVFLSIWPLPGADEIAIADKVYVLLEDINKTLPDGMEITIAYDVTQYMRAALTEIFTTLVETVVLVGLVVVAMMGSVRSALVPLVTIPISLLGAIAAMMMMGFSLNLLTVLAIVLSVGLVVDDAIVVVENVARYLREGKGRIEAALASSRQLLAPIIGMTITLATVYAPIGFLSGLTGALFKEFAFTLATAVLISGVVALTLSPMMSAYVCPLGGAEGDVTRKVNHGFTRLQRAYGHLLGRVFGWQPQLLAGALFLSLLVVPFYLLSQKELAPIEDQSKINIITEAPPEGALPYSAEYMHEVVDTLLAFPNTRYLWQVITPSGGFGGLQFVEAHERDFDVQALLPEVFAALSQVTGIKVLPVLFPPLPTAGRFDVEMVVLSSESPKQMKKYADELVAAAYKSSRFLFADTDLKVDLPQAKVQLNHRAVADLGMTLEDVSEQLGVLLSGDYVGRYDAEGRAYEVIPMLDKPYRSDPDTLMETQLITPSGDYVQLSSIATLQRATAPRLLGKFQQQNSFRIFGGVLPGSTKEQALAALEAAAAELLPEGYALDYAGESRQLRQEGNTMIGVLGVALMLVFLVLAVQFNSFRDPLVVLIGSVPLAIASALLFPFLGWTTVNIYSQVGFITLVGLIAKNAILVVEFANHLQADGLSKNDAIIESATTRLRPVLMTTGATVLGHFPLVLVSGAGAEARNSIGIILVAGMLVGTLFTLFILPLVYRVLAADHHRVGDPVALHKTA